ncbi:lipid II:glycine glycyltransferase FemX [Bacillus pinisoli]|uniref:lipid II:glycine glycyltransferase FemX n=1 Tax=Bacillus pinisoli TaxID=2901866 RepID=UPI001FF19A5A|nr:peptidoglycan bridge formation glycyltransferase FemA/FemB family protein [Bacillus pinisoli]
MYYSLSGSNKEEWQRELEGCGLTDIYFQLEYCQLYTSLGDGEPYLFVYEHNGDKIIYPFLKRELATLPFVNDKEKYFDSITPYGYGGPIGTLSETMVKGFRQAFEEYCQKENIITEFIRFHPLVKNELYHEEYMDVLNIRDTVYINLEQDEESLLRNFHKNHRRNTRKAIMQGLTTRIIQGSDAVDEIPTFLNLYYQTMDKNKASDYYYFPSAYFHRIFTDLPNNSLMVVVYNHEVPIAAAIFLYQEGFLHYHLGGSDKKFLHLGANHLLYYQAALWGINHQFKQLHLGGGYKGDDSLFQYKKRFNPTGLLNFYIGKKVHHEEKYLELIKSWKNYYRREEYNKEFFPIYRQ